MVRIRKRLMETMRFKVDVTQQDIDEGGCRLASRCMHKLAASRALLAMDETLSDAALRMRVDGGHIWFNYGGAHWAADMPKIAKASLIDFDHKRKVEPHSYWITARKIGTIKRISPERQQQINAARRKRVSEGKPDRPHNARMTLRKRVIGFA